MICPGPDADSYRICVHCRACYPGLSPRVQEILDLSMSKIIITSQQKLVEEVMA